MAGEVSIKNMSLTQAMILFSFLKFLIIPIHYCLILKLKLHLLSKVVLAQYHLSNYHQNKIYQVEQIIRRLIKHTETLKYTKLNVKHAYAIPTPWEKKKLSLNGGKMSFVRITSHFRK